ARKNEDAQHEEQRREPAVGRPLEARTRDERAEEAAVSVLEPLELCLDRRACVADVAAAGHEVETNRRDEDQSDDGREAVREDDRERGVAEDGVREIRSESERNENDERGDRRRDDGEAD